MTDVERCVLYTDRDRLAAVIGHVVQNAQEATPRDGTVSVRLWPEEGQGHIEVRDTGVGMDEPFVRERLFKPFDSTKGLAGMGIGAYECREFIRALGGWVEVQSAPGRGTRFLMIVPLAEPVG
jgi:signal transduction histidine kinase